MTTAGQPKLLLIEDEAQVRRFLRASLPAQGYTLLEAATGGEGLAMAASHNPDVILLDLGLPDLDGLEVTQRLREWSEAPILIISARGQERDKVAALDAGADDYVTKPFGVDELLARVRVALRHRARRGSGQDESTFASGELRVDLGRRQVHVADREVHLTPIEYKLLVALVRHAGRVLTHQQLLREVWGARYATQTQYLHVHMGHLRAKVEENAARPKLLVTEAGVGYRLRSE